MHFVRRVSIEWIYWYCWTEHGPLRRARACWLKCRIFKEGVLPSEVSFKKCGTKCHFRKDDNVWRCHGYTANQKRRNYCNFSISDYHGTFLDKTKLEPWKIVLFANHWDHANMIRCLGLSLKSSVDWRSFCSEMAENWLEHELRIGVPIDARQIQQR